MKRIALAGNPNSGKTTLYNLLTGQNEKVGNWAGVTVDKREAVLRDHNDVMITDLPGAYSLDAYTSEESITTDFVLQAQADVLINIIDATNLSRALFFTTQLLELGIPTVIALNKSDLCAQKGITIDQKLLSELLTCPIVNISALDKNGIDELIEVALSLKEAANHPSHRDEERYDYTDKIVKQVEKRTTSTAEETCFDRLDEKLTNPFFGLLVFIFVMFGVFYISQVSLGAYLADWLTLRFDAFKELVSTWFSDASPVLRTILLDGIIDGVSAVLSFLPLVMIMYFLIALLEDCGYMARVSVLLDPLFKRVGLTGKSIIPFIIGTGCSIPGIMACRTIKADRERKATAMLTPFMPCGAKLPVIALFAGAFFPDNAYIGVLMYFVGILLILLGALLIRYLTRVEFNPSYFIIELPDYKLPSLRFAINSMFERGKSYIIKAGTIILLCNTTVNLIQSFNWSFEFIEAANESILASIASPLAYLLVPVIGVVSWQLAAATITGLIAKENVVGTLAVCFAGLDKLIDVEELAMIAGSGQDVAQVIALTKAAALAYLMLNLYMPPCFAALGAMREELAEPKWFWGGVLLQFIFGFTTAFIVYQGGTLLMSGHLGAAFFQGIISIAIMVVLFLLVFRFKEAD